MPAGTYRNYSQGVEYHCTMFNVAKRTSRTRHAAIIGALAPMAFLTSFAFALAVFLAPPAWGRPFAHGAHSRHVAHRRTIVVNEHTHLRLTSSHSGMLYERGIFSGTPGGGIAVRIQISYTKSKIWFSSTPSGGAVSGSGWASFYAEGPVAHFSGSVAVKNGTGRYSGARASALRISGTIQRNTDAISLTVRGQMRV
jgi:hypothetical protein